MSQSEINNNDEGEGKIDGFIKAWNASRDHFDEYVENVSRTFRASRLKLTAAAKWVESNPAEIWAILRLAALDDKLSLFGVHPPPKITWLAFADATSDQAIKGGLEALANLKEGDSAYLVVLNAIRKVEGPGVTDRIGLLSGKVFWNACTKAKKYDALTPNARHALADFAKIREKDKSLSPRQIAFAQDLLLQLVDANVIKRNSIDGDKDLCDQVLNALGM